MMVCGITSRTFFLHWYTDNVGAVMAKTILVVDDEKRLIALIRSYLMQEGFRVLAAGNGKQALLMARKEKPDLILLDIMMPDMDGYEFLRLHRQEEKTPIILLTARIADDDKVKGLDLGADDYITKPFKPRELMSRIQAVLRRSGNVAPTPNIFHAGDILLDKQMRTVQVKDRYVDLTPSEFDILTALIASPGRVFSRLDLLDIIQGIRYEGYERSIDTHVKNLRAKIESEPRTPKYIETIYGVGYRFARK
jgi:DNA-binding response OmpR family regulator